MKQPLLLLLLLVCAVQSVLSLQHTIPSLARSRRCKNVIPRFASVNGNSNNGDLSFIGMSNNDNTYVPSGMTPEAYSKLKQKEAAQRAQLDFGAWGPRFARSEAPRGDWMVAPSLWTKGFQFGNTNDESGPEAPTEEQLVQAQRRRAALRSVVVSFLVAYSVWEILLMGYTSIRSVAGGKRAFTALLFTSRGVWSWKMQSLKLALAAVSTRCVHQYRDIAQRRWLWSSRRKYGLPIAASLGAVASLTAIALGFPLLFR